MLNFPEETEVNRFIPKNKFYENADISPALKESFSKTVEKITWANKISPSTLNIAPSDNINELQVFWVKLKTPDFNEKILETIDKAIPFYILFVLEYGERYCLYLGYKEKTENGSINKAKISRYFKSEWSETINLELKGNRIDTIYENFLSQLSDGLIDTAGEEDLKAKVEKTIAVAKLEQQIAKLTVRLRAEKQLNRQLEIRAQIKQLQAQIEDLTNG